MLFLDEKRCFGDFIFLHIPKTGGTSIERSLGIHGCNCHWHTKSGNFLFGEKIDIIKTKIKNWEKKIKFCFVRNPWDRLVSTFFYLKNLKNLKHQPLSSHKTVYLSKVTTFEDWIIKHENKEQGLENLNGFWLSPQTNWVGENFFDFIGRFENLEIDFKKLFDKNLPHLNKTFHENYKKYYTLRTQEIVEKWYFEDIKKFNYKF
jgi:hypothetical protein